MTGTIAVTDEAAGVTGVGIDVGTGAGVVSLAVAFGRRSSIVGTLDIIFSTVPLILGRVTLSSECFACWRFR